MELLKCHDVDLSKPEEHEAKIIEVLEVYEAKFKCNTPLRLQLNLIRSDNAVFKAKLKKYMKPQVIKGVPSLINDMSDFYKDSVKA